MSKLKFPKGSLLGEAQETVLALRLTADEFGPFRESVRLEAGELIPVTLRDPDPLTAELSLSLGARFIIERDANDRVLQLVRGSAISALHRVLFGQVHQEVLAIMMEVANGKRIAALEKCETLLGKLNGRDCVPEVVRERS